MIPFFLNLLIYITLKKEEGCGNIKFFKKKKKYKNVKNYLKKLIKALRKSIIRAPKHEVFH